MEQASLMSQLAFADCLNQDTECTLQAMATGKGVLKSDCDEQLILHYAFPPNEAANISSVTFVGPAGAALPSVVKFYVNERALTFDTVESRMPKDTVTLKWAAAPGDGNSMIATAAVPHVRQLAAYQFGIFVETNTSNGADDVTVVSDIQIVGQMAKGLGTTAPPQKG